MATITLRCSGVGAYLSRKAPLVERKMSATSRRGRLRPGWAAHGSVTIGPYLFASSVLRLREPVERACDLPKIPGAHLSVMSRRRQTGMPKQRLNYPDIGPIFKEVRGESVPK